jgi:hypothetical protein
MKYPVADPLTGGYKCAGCQANYPGKPATVSGGRPYHSKQCKAAQDARFKAMKDEISTRAKKAGIKRRRNPVIKSVAEWKKFYEQQDKKRRKAIKPDPRVPKVRNVSPKRTGLLAWLFGW